MLVTINRYVTHNAIFISHNATFCDVTMQHSIIKFLIKTLRFLRYFIFLSRT